MNDNEYNISNEYAHLQEQPLSKMNSGLFNTYNSYRIKFDERNFFKSHEKYELPYFIAASKNYEKAKYRIMVIAQETRGWGSEFSHNHNYSPIVLDNFEVDEYVKILKQLNYPDEIIRALMILYDERVNKDWGVPGILWKFYENLRVELEQKQLPFTFGFIHNNIAKIANRDGKEFEEVRSGHPLNKELIQLINDEIEITDPNLIIFCTGNDSHYEEYMKELSPEIVDLAETLSSLNKISNMSECKIGGKKRKIICCYHPCHLIFAKGGLKTSTDKIITLIKNEYS